MHTFDEMSECATDARIQGASDTIPGIESIEWRAYVVNRSVTVPSSSMLVVWTVHVRTIRDDVTFSTHYDCFATESGGYEVIRHTQSVPRGTSNYSTIRRNADRLNISRLFDTIVDKLVNATGIDQ